MRMATFPIPSTSRIGPTELAAPGTRSRLRSSQHAFFGWLGLPSALFREECTILKSLQFRGAVMRIRQGLVGAAIIMVAGVTSITAFGQISRGDRYSGAQWVTRSPVLAQHGMACTEQPLASQIAIDILKKGGSAIDAAIAANAAIGLMQPVLNGIGGDLFAIVWDPKTKKLYGYNGSGRAPMGRDLARMKAEVEAAYTRGGQTPKAHIPPVGTLPITVPGAVDAWFALHGKFGKLPMAEDLEP